VDQQEAERLGFDVEADQRELRKKHSAKLRYNPVECTNRALSCNAVTLEAEAQIAEITIDDIEPSRDGAGCTAATVIEYLAAVHLSSSDGSLSGTYYSILGPSTDDAGELQFSAHAFTDLRNFDGTLPLTRDLAPRHYAYLDVDLGFGSDGTAWGRLAPMVQVFDPASSAHALQRIGPDAYLGDDARYAEADAKSVLGNQTDLFTLSSYPGSELPPLVALTLRADAVGPAVDVDVRVSVNGKVTQEKTVPAGTSLDLGQQPFGTKVDFSVTNTRGAATVGATILQDNCFVASASCETNDCAADAQYVTTVNFCFN
jgi:hypothetical protein